MKWTDSWEYSIYQYYIRNTLINTKIESVSHKDQTRLQPNTLHLRFVIKHLKKSNVNFIEALPETKKATLQLTV